MATSRAIYVTNTMGRKLEELHTIAPGQATVYTCGPTVYSYQHIGNFRAFIFADTLRRMLEYNGLEVRHVRNITDVGHLTNETLGTGVDKMEAAARKTSMTPEDIATHFTEIFHHDAQLLNMLEPSAEPRATQFIGPMIDLTETLIDRGHAYESDGSVYFEVSTFPAYGRLSGNAVDELIAGARVEVGEGKRSPADFALWKHAEPEKLMHWDSPWGEGVPGWHLECSAMAINVLGEEIDIHTGGEDHVFPHHEDEIAQSEGATGKTFSPFWMHNAFLQLPGEEKMSKSLGNIFTVSDLKERGIHPLSFRFYNFLAHYRTPVNFTWEALEAAQTALYRVFEATAELLQGAEPAASLDEAAFEHQATFHQAINRDLDLPGAIAAVHGVIGSKLDPAHKLALLSDFDRVLALDTLAISASLSELREGERELLDRRAEARSSRDWAASDALRAQLAEGGLDVKDTAQGQRWLRRDVLPRSRAQDS